MIIKGNITDTDTESLLPISRFVLNKKSFIEKLQFFSYFHYFYFHYSTTDVVQIISVSKHKIGQNEKGNMANFEVFQRA